MAACYPCLTTCELLKRSIASLVVQIHQLHFERWWPWNPAGKLGNKLADMENIYRLPLDYLCYQTTLNGTANARNTMCNGHASRNRMILLAESISVMHASLVTIACVILTVCLITEWLKRIIYLVSNGVSVNL